MRDRLPKDTFQDVGYDEVLAFLNNTNGNSPHHHVVYGTTGLNLVGEDIQGEPDCVSVQFLISRKVRLGHPLAG